MANDQGIEIQIGIISSGDRRCRVTGFNARTDSTRAVEFPTFALGRWKLNLTTFSPAAAPTSTTRVCAQRNSVCYSRSCRPYRDRKPTERSKGVPSNRAEVQSARSPHDSGRFVSW
jgi:hypothetical protein